MPFFKFLFIFCLFSTVGWVLELVFRSILMKKLVNPGFMSGCVVPLYGFGAIIMSIICNLFQNVESNYRIILIFIFAVIFLSLLEFISGFILLKFFHIRLWDYSEFKYNYKGFICIEFSILWGALALLFYSLVYPWLDSLSISFIENNVCLFFLGIYVGIFIIDLCASIQLLNRVTKYANSIRQIIDIEKLKLESRLKIPRKRFWNAIYPYISTNKFLRDKVRDINKK